MPHSEHKMYLMQSWDYRTVFNGMIYSNSHIGQQGPILHLTYIVSPSKSQSDLVFLILGMTLELKSVKTSYVFDIFRKLTRL